MASTDWSNVAKNSTTWSTPSKSSTDWSNVSKNSTAWSNPFRVVGVLLQENSSYLETEDGNHLQITTTP